MKALFEALRWRHPHGVKGLNNNYTALYARRLLAAHPEWASAPSRSVPGAAHERPHADTLRP
ncbi:hypothetical protein ACFYM5_10585 [Streptomyces sp. NPDC006706]|uniref:hypothetical protein n=1 Tax=Streptomyces sp. NPDC006706 TaxID=3364761 RepID=UPI0036BF11F7